MTSNLIGIAGKAGTGKTTLARLLCELLPSHWGVCSFADEVKLEASRRYGFDVTLAYSPGGKETEIYTYQWGKVTVREILQRYGTDMIRALNEDHWVRRFEATYRHRLSLGAATIVDDIRFPNEADWVLRNGGHLVYLMPYSGWEPGDRADHESETALDAYSAFSEVFLPSHGGLGNVAQMIARVVR